MNRRDPPPDIRARFAVLWRRWGGHLIGALAFVLLAAVVWHLLSGTASTRREVAATPTLVLPPPPPPPPEPEKLPEPEPEKVKPEVREPEPKPQEPLDPPRTTARPVPRRIWATRSPSTAPRRPAPMRSASARDAAAA
ncbi:hypothetical protein [Cupriavidus campinensis]|uniref:hypothetical protein n=1 Tax=Cupriavidus campinensis TaxID=151783 RepID=UPI0021CCD2EC|nr:hypothetical protein [Cupriavidus campinensis]